MLAAKCGPAHIIQGYDESAVRFADFDIKIDERINKKSSPKKYDKENDAELQKMLKDFFSTNTLEEEEKKARCNLCKKLFRSKDFMQKHLETKHSEEYQGVIKERFKTIMLDNYIADPDKLQNQIISAGDRFRGGIRRGGGDRPAERGDRQEVVRDENALPTKRPADESYNDLDDPKKHPKMTRAMVDYSDL